MDIAIIKPVDILDIMIYFVLCNTEWIKIGFTVKNDASDRIDAMRTGNPYELTLIATMKGTQLDEYRLHKMFAKYRGKGEWFRFNLTIMRYLMNTKKVKLHVEVLAYDDYLRQKRHRNCVAG